MLYTLRFSFSSKCSLFHNANLFSSCIIHILYTECAKSKKKKKFWRQKFNHRKCFDSQCTGVVTLHLSRYPLLTPKLRIKSSSCLRENTIRLHCQLSLSLGARWRAVRSKFGVHKVRAVGRRNCVMLLKSEPCESQMATRSSRASCSVFRTVIPASRDVMCLVRYRALNPRFDVE